MLILYGGAFNPPTIAHDLIISKLSTSYPKSKIIILPVGNNYNKSHLIDAKYRLAMCNLIVSKYVNVSVSDYEILNPFKGTINTLKHFDNKQEDILYVIGDDNLLEIETWVDYQMLLKSYQFIIITRNINKLDKYLAKYEDLWIKKPIVINIKENVSSTMVRNDLLNSKNLLTNEVYEFIINNNLYQ